VRTLIQLIIRNHRLVLFVLLEIIALSWLASTHAHPRGSLAKIGMEMSTSWTGAVEKLINYKNLKENNSSLLIDNARLRTENMSFRSLSTSASQFNSGDHGKAPLQRSSDTRPLLKTTFWSLIKVH